MINDEFCNLLEYKICQVLKDADSALLNSYWCDGVMLTGPESGYSQAWVNNKRAVTMKAFIGTDGQDELELILKFGPKSLSRYARNLDLVECIPETANWFLIDPDHRSVQVQLD